jgi:hypothetical protein
MDRGGGMSRWAIIRAADDARAEADRLRAEFSRAMILEDESDVLWGVADDAFWAWRRAEDRARFARQLADQERDGYNVWDGDPA